MSKESVHKKGFNKDIEGKIIYFSFRTEIQFFHILAKVGKLKRKRGVQNALEYERLSCFNEKLGSVGSKKQLILQMLC